MTNGKSRAAEATARASHELDRALEKSTTAATVEMLRMSLRDRTDPDVLNWVDGIGPRGGVITDAGRGLTRAQQEAAVRAANGERAEYSPSASQRTTKGAYTDDGDGC